MADRLRGRAPAPLRSQVPADPGARLRYHPTVGAVVREQLLRRIEVAADARILVVTGVAGSGKSALVGQWADRLSPQRPVAWIALDPRDNSPTRLWAHIHSSLKDAIPDLSWQPAPRDDDGTTDALVSELNARFPLLTIVLDDLHFLLDDRTLTTVGALVSGLGATSRLALISRTRPQLRLSKMLAAGDAVQIRGEDLFFTPDETEHALHAARGDVLGAPPGTAREVHEFTGGWPVAVGLAVRLAWPADGLGRPDPQLARIELADYLTEEVFQTQSEEVQQFLLDTVVLDAITVEAANVVRERLDAAHWLDRLERDHPFLTRVGSGSQARWQLHAIVRDYLRERLEREEPLRWKERHLRAGQFFVATDLERAMTHLLMAGAYDMAADLLESRIDDLATWQGVENPLLLRWLEAMPDPVIARRPRLFAQALGLARYGQRYDLYQRWVRVRPTMRSNSLEHWLAEAEAADDAGDAERMRIAALAGLQVAKANSTWALDFHSYLSHAEALLGHWSAAAASMRQVRRAVSVTQPAARHAQELVHAGVVVQLARSGDRAGCRSALADLNRWLQEAAEHGYTSVGGAQWAAAMIAYYDRDFTEADSLWSTLPSVQWARGQPLMDVIFWLDLARVRRAAGHPEEARELLDRLEVTLRQFVNPGRMLEWVAEEAGLLASGPATPLTAPLSRTSTSPGAAADAAGSPASAPGSTPLVEPLSQREVEIVRLLRSEFSAPEIAAHLCISYNTVKTHTKTIYRKLNTGSRSQAVAQAVHLGYL